MAYTAGDVMRLAGALLNDRNITFFSFEKQLPFLRSAADDLDLAFQGSGISIQTSVCNVNTAIAATTVTLPCLFFLPLRLEQRVQTSTDDDAFTDIVEGRVEPSAKAVQNIEHWAFRNNRIYITPSTEAKTIRVTFRRSLVTLADQTTVGEVLKAKNFLAFRTAALCAEFLGGNKPIGDSLNLQAMSQLDELDTAYVKNSQGGRVRRKPFRVPRAVISVGR